MTQREIERLRQQLDDYRSRYRGHPLLAGLEAMFGHYDRMARRLQKVANIGDGLHAEMVRLNEALQTSEARYRLLTDNAMDVLWQLGMPHRQLSYVSPSIARLTGYSAEEALVQSLEEMFTPASANRLQDAFTHLMRRGELPHPGMELERRRKDGSTVWTEDVFTVVEAEHGQPVIVVGVSRDISVRRAAQEEQKRFFAMVAHEFRTPLATIDGAIQRLEMTAPDDLGNATRQRYTRIQNAVHRLTRLLDDYLDQDRIAPAGQRPQLIPVAPRALLEDSAASARALSAAHTIMVDDADMPPTILCAPDLMRLTLRVLVDNAVKYTPEGSTIRLSCHALPQAQGVELLVADDGPGIPQDELPQLFDRFFRGRAAGSRSGTGLGLHLAQSAVATHRGTLSARNRAAGGAEFRIWLPADPAAGEVRIG